MKKILLCLLLISSCKSYENVLTDFEDRLFENQIVKKNILTQINSDEPLTTRHEYSASILNKDKFFEFYAMNLKKENFADISGKFTLWDRQNNTIRKKLFFPNKISEITERDAGELESLFKKDNDDLSSTPWRLLISKKTSHKYSKCFPKEEFGYMWYVFTGNFKIKEYSPHFKNSSDSLVLFQIWIREDMNLWMEFYSNSKNEIKIAIEGTFLVSEDEQKFLEPENIKELQNSLSKSFKKTLLYKMNILKNSEFGRDLYNQ